MADKSDQFELRCYTLIDQMQPQLAAFMGTVTQGDPPIQGMASLYIELAPGSQVYRLMDMALKATDVRPGAQIVERVFGMLEVHSFSQEEVREAGRVILEQVGLTEKDRLKPVVASVQYITNVGPRQAQILNAFTRGSMLVAGETLLVVECAPAAYAAYATNEAEKAADIKVLHVRVSGRYGRSWMSGTEAFALAARKAAVRALEEIEGKEPKK